MPMIIIVMRKCCRWHHAPTGTQVRGLQSASLICTLHLGPNRPNPTPKTIDAFSIGQVPRCMVLHGLHGILAAMGFVVLLDIKHRKANPDRVCSVNLKRHWYQCTSGRHQDDIQPVAVLHLVPHQQEAQEQGLLRIKRTKGTRTGDVTRS